MGKGKHRPLGTLEGRVGNSPIAFRVRPPDYRHICLRGSISLSFAAGAVAEANVEALSPGLVARSGTWLPTFLEEAGQAS
jgi:hypothetical protein